MKSVKLRAIALKSVKKRRPHYENVSSDINLKQFIISHDFIYPKKGIDLFYQLAFNIRSFPVIEYAYDSYI